MNPSPSGAGPSAWVARWAHLAPTEARVLDLACGSGRHFRWWARRGHAVTGVDRDATHGPGLSALGRWIQADLEAGPWPLGDAQFDVVLVTNYLWRPLFPSILGALAPGGLLLYETFSEGQARFGRPSRPEFLLRHGELLERCTALRIVAYEDGLTGAPLGSVQRIAALRPPSTGLGRSEEHFPRLEASINTPPMPG